MILFYFILFLFLFSCLYQAREYAIRRERRDESQLTIMTMEIIMTEITVGAQSWMMLCANAMQNAGGGVGHVTTLHSSTIIAKRMRFLEIKDVSVDVPTLFCRMSQRRVWTQFRAEEFGRS